MYRKTLIFLIALCLGITSFAQEDYFMTGLLPDDGTYDQLPMKKELVTKGYENLPSKFSLMQYCPEVKSQSNYCTCTSWATAYAARTIAEAIRYGWTDKSKITQEAFSPLFVYAQIKEAGDTNCKKGSYIYEALRLLKSTGTPKFEEFHPLCAAPADVNRQLTESASNYKIDQWCTLFYLGCNDKHEKIRKVKKSISEKHPVVIAMWLDKSSFYETREMMSLQNAATGFPTKQKNTSEGYHAMCVVGYDDNMHGGAFQVMNSWGADWGDEGFFWAKYDDFARTVDQAYEIVVSPLSRPIPQPNPTPEPVVLNEFAAQLEMRQRDGGEMRATQNTQAGMYYYILNEGVKSGDRYRIYISNNEPAYVYVIGSDLRNNVSELFPHPMVKENGQLVKKNFSPALTYKSNQIVLPDEDYSIRVDNTLGKDYWCLLYSKEELDIDDIVSRIESSGGSFYEKVKTALGDKMVPKDDIRFVMNRIEFSARSEKTVVPVIIEALHH